MGKGTNAMPSAPNYSQYNPRRGWRPPQNAGSFGAQFSPFMPPQQSQNPYPNGPQVTPGPNGEMPASHPPTGGQAPQSLYPQMPVPQQPSAPQPPMGQNDYPDGPHISPGQNGEPRPTNPFINPQSYQQQILAQKYADLDASNASYNAPGGPGYRLALANALK